MRGHSNLGARSFTGTTDAGSRSRIMVRSHESGPVVSRSPFAAVMNPEPNQAENRPILPKPPAAKAHTP